MLSARVLPVRRRGDRVQMDAAPPARVGGAGGVVPDRVGGQGDGAAPAGIVLDDDSPAVADAPGAGPVVLDGAPVKGQGAEQGSQPAAVSGAGCSSAGRIVGRSCSCAASPGPGRRRRRRRPAVSAPP